MKNPNHLIVCKILVKAKEIRSKFFFIESSILQSSRAKQREVSPKDFCATLRSKAKTLQAATGRVAAYEAVLEWCGRLSAEEPLQQNKG